MQVTDPIKKLYECHDHIWEIVTRLKKLGDDARERGMASLLEWRDEWENTLRFLTVGAAALHTRDEEEALFPVLQRYNVTEPIDKLHKEHLASHEFMDAFAARVRAILASGEASDEEICTIADQCELIYHNYDQHINDENENLFPIAQSLMTADEKSEVAELMTKFREEADISPSGSPVGPVFAELMPNKPKEAP